jgi:hypothetical protein
MQEQVKEDLRLSKADKQAKDIALNNVKKEELAIKSNNYVLNRYLSIIS